MFESTTQTATFFFVPDASRANSQTGKQPEAQKPTATAPVKVSWVGH